MQIRIGSDALEAVRAGALVVPVFSGEPLEGAAASVDRPLGGALADVLQSGEIRGKLCEHALVHAKDQPFRRVLIIGLGERSSYETSLLARYAGTAVRALGHRGIESMALALPGEASRDPREAACAIAQGAIAGSFETTIYQKQPESTMSLERVEIVREGLDEKTLASGVQRGSVIGEAINFARRLAISPANDMTPEHLGKEATSAAKDAGISIDVHDEQWARSQGMGSFLSVAQGSAQSPKFIVMRYNGDATSKELLALVGKGITFDSGGISLKPPERMEDMKYDMSGGAGVIASMCAIGRLKPRLNVVGIVPATENMPGGRATKPGDIAKAMNGKTIEIINTDAEGRLILADALCYANGIGATRIVDAATLTGACVVALGHHASALVSNNDAFAQAFLDAAKPTGERYWRMPLFEEYGHQMKSDIADLKNTGGRDGGTLTAAAFLKAFAGDTPWVHLDIAGTAYLDRGSAWLAKGPTGVPVRAFLSLAERLAS
ncbi:MAG: leucyl aminopeptidase [Candidatus Tyrphobacter sp.]